MALYTLTRGKMRPHALKSSATLSQIPIPTMPYGPPPPYDSQRCNVVIFGETGVGKSSVVNLIAGRKLADTSPDAGACTFSSDSFVVLLGNNRPFCVWDTIGLNEPEMKNDDYLRAIKQAYKLIKELESSGGVHLLLLCMRGRVTKSVQQNYRLFVDVLCEKKVPLAVVVTNLENEPCMEEWWTNNNKVFNDHGISTDGHACITATTGIDDFFIERYNESRETMHELILKLTSQFDEGWKKDKRAWLISLLGKMTRFLPMRPHSRTVHPTSKELVAKLVKECGFEKKEASAIATSITEIRDQARLY